MTDTVREIDTLAMPTGWPEPGKMHFRLVDYELGQLDLTCENGYCVNEYDLGFPEVREVAYPNSLDDGTLDVTQFIGARTVNLQITLRNRNSVTGVGPKIASERELRDRLLAFLHPKRRPLLLFTEHEDDLVRQIQLRGSEAGIPVARGRYNQLSVSWVAPLGIIESYQQHCEILYMNQAQDTLLATVQNRGNVPAHWRMRLEGEIVNPSLGIGSDVVKLNYQATVGSITEIDSFAKTVRIDGRRVGFKFLDDKSRWFQVPPGSALLSLQHDAIARTGRPWAFWQNDGGNPPLGALPNGMTRSPTNWGDAGPTWNPDPKLSPPWAWTPDRDPNTPDTPAMTVATVCWRDAWI